jgi:RNA polymerase sigma factor (TIGR02999 family)
MVASSTDTVSLLLRQVRADGRAALDRLFPIVYADLRQLAGARRRRWHGDETLNTTALVHEAYLRLAQQSGPDWRDRAHFFAVASQAMRHVLVDYARRRRTAKRGGEWQRLTLDELESALTGGPDPDAAREYALLALEGALGRLERHNSRHVRIVECRFFGGMTIPETAEALGISASTVTRGWAAAQAWLYRELRRTTDSAS